MAAQGTGWFFRSPILANEAAAEPLSRPLRISSSFDRVAARKIGRDEGPARSFLAPSSRPCHIPGMTQPDKKPDMQPRELKDGSGWYVYVNWGYLPAEQVGGFPSEDEARDWIKRSAAGWLKARSED
jgi:hypothetical protein